MSPNQIISSLRGATRSGDLLLKVRAVLDNFSWIAKTEGCSIELGCLLGLMKDF